MSSSDRKTSLFHPSLWPAWIGVFLFRQICRLPWKFQTALGAGLGGLCFHVIRLRRNIVEVNLALCFPELSHRERRTLAATHFRAIGIGLFETCLAWWAPDDRLPPYEIIGREHLEQAVSRERGVLLLTAHFTTLEICGRMFSREFTMGGLYREPDNRVIALQMRRGRIDKLRPAIPMDDLRGLIRALKNRHIIWYAPDQVKKGKFSAILPFFGVPALTNTATSRIAHMSGTAVVPYFALRKPDGTYQLNILPALEDFPSGDDAADAICINGLIEQSIRLAPEQYFWVHRRFKRRGEGFDNVYL
jgi:KDO2-lipid IV(A) lauroyltransferase